MSIYSTYSDKIYNNYLQKRFGINGCCSNKTTIDELNNDLCIADYLRKKQTCSQKVYYKINTSDTVVEGLYIAVEVGTPQAIAAGIAIADTSYTNPLLKDRNIQVFRNGIVLTPFQRDGGLQYYTKDKASDTIQFSEPLQEGEIIQINTI